MEFKIEAEKPKLVESLRCGMVFIDKDNQDLFLLTNEVAKDDNEIQAISLKNGQSHWFYKEDTIELMNSKNPKYIIKEHVKVSIGTM